MKAGINVQKEDNGKTIVHTQEEYETLLEEFEPEFQKQMNAGDAHTKRKHRKTPNRENTHSSQAPRTNESMIADSAIKGSEPEWFKVNQFIYRVASQQHEKTKKFTGKPFLYEQLSETDQKEIFDIEKHLTNHNEKAYQLLYRAYRCLCKYKTGTFWNWFEYFFRDIKDISPRTADMHIRVMQTREMLTENNVDPSLIETYNDQYLKVQYELYRTVSFKDWKGFRSDIMVLIQILTDIQKLGKRLSVKQFMKQFSDLLPKKRPTKDDYHKEQTGKDEDHPETIHKRWMGFLNKELDKTTFQTMLNKLDSSNDIRKLVIDALRTHGGFLSFDAVELERTQLLEVWELVERLAKTLNKPRTEIYAKISEIVLDWPDPPAGKPVQENSFMSGSIHKAA